MLRSLALWHDKCILAPDRVELNQSGYDLSWRLYTGPFGFSLPAKDAMLLKVWFRARTQRALVLGKQKERELRG